jgi:hypothetical protein
LRQLQFFFFPAIVLGRARTELTNGSRILKQKILLVVASVAVGVVETRKLET